MILGTSSVQTKTILRIIFYGLIIVGLALLVMTVENMRNSRMMPSLTGALINIGTKGGRTVTQMTFDQNEVSEVIPHNHLVVALIPDTEDISGGETLSTALTAGKRIFGYKYSSRDAALEIAAAARAESGEPLTYSELFPGTFFASAAERNAGTFITDFEAQKNISFQPLSQVTLERNARYVVVTADQGTMFTVRGLMAVCGNGIFEAGEQCDAATSSGCSTTCRAGLGDLVIDDGDLGFLTTGPWTRTTAQGGWNGDRLTVPALNSRTCTFGANCVMQTDASASWTFTSLPAGTYEVYVKWRNPETLRPASQHRISDGQSELATIAFPWANMQKDSTGHWGRLGSYAVTSGTLTVETRNNVGWFNNQYPAEIVADAVMIRRSVCGDGVPEGGEACDDGGTSSGDGCSATCSVESGYSSCSGAPSICVPIVCGDSTIEGAEVCDDGNHHTGDGCSSQCVVESNHRCSGEPSICHENIPNHFSVLTHIGTTTESDIALGSDGLPIVVYLEPVNLRRLVVVHCGNADCSDGNTSSFVVQTTEAKRMPHIAIGSDGLPIITYYKYDEQVMSVVHCEAVDCSSSTIVSLSGRTDEAIIGASIIVGADGLPFITYVQNVALPKLTIVRCGDVACRTDNIVTMIDSTAEGLIERHHAVTMSADGLPIIAYVTHHSSNSNNRSLWLRRCDDASCSQSTAVLIQTTLTVNGVTRVVSGPVNIMIGATGYPVIGYTNIKHTTNTDDSFVHLVHCGNESCTQGNLETNPLNVTGGISTLAMGGDELPVISLLDRMLHCGTTRCDGSATLYTPISPRPISPVSCVVSAGGTPMCTYVHGTTNALMFMKCGDNECYAP